MALSLRDRAIGAIIGAAVADAAAQPMHWIYSPDKLKEILSDLEPCPEFRPQSANPFYRRTTGEQTCYGDQAYVLLESLSQCGDVNVEDLTKRFYKFFGPGTVYDLPLNDPYRKKGGPKAILPIDGPWRNGSLKAFFRNVDAGKEETGSDVDCQMDGVTKLAPVVAMYAGRPEMLEKVEKAMRVTQNNDMCLAVTLAAARFLEHFILNGPDRNALDAVLAQLNDPKRQNPQELDLAVISLPGAFQGALLGVLTLNQLDEAVRDTMRCGGCTASRASFIGACFGAQLFSVFQHTVLVLWLAVSVHSRLSEHHFQSQQAAVFIEKAKDALHTVQHKTEQVERLETKETDVLLQSHWKPNQSQRERVNIGLNQKHDSYLLPHVLLLKFS
ncbi:Crystallin J1B [Nibea albiflora]|uniref:Crystallin J1B n=1 Tax=Nibea albiflora TaxID=240163 RepID=A0ACB7F5C2_NIBAL|nr:Crystallin J1B [Nibea albiflora]